MAISPEAAALVARCFLTTDPVNFPCEKRVDIDLVFVSNIYQSISSRVEFICSIFYTGLRENLSIRRERSKYRRFFVR